MDEIFEHLLLRRSEEPYSPHAHGLDVKLASELVDEGRSLVLVSGMRGTGKTSVLFNLAKRLEDRGISPKNVLYLRLSDPRIPRTTSVSLIDVIDAYLWRFPDVRKAKLYLVVDDLQRDLRWLESFVSLQEVYDVALAGASAARSWARQCRDGGFPFGTIVHELFPAGMESFDAAEADSLQRFSDYKLKGGLLGPDTSLISLDNRGQALVVEALALDIMPCDTRFSYQVAFPFMALALASTGKPFSVAAAATTLKERGVRTTRATLTALLDAAEEACLLHRVRELRHCDIANPRMASMVYAGDHGLARCFTPPGAIDEEGIARTMVLVELLRRYRESGRKVFFYRTARNGHVDFAVVEEGGAVGLLATVCFADPQSKAYHEAILALSEASGETGARDAVLLTDARIRRQPLSNEGVLVTPLLYWLADGG